MEVDINSDDLFVVIIGDNIAEEDVKIDTTDLSQFENVKVKEEVLDEATGIMGVEDIFHNVELHGELLDMDLKQIVKEEPEDLPDDDEDYAPNSNDDDDDIDYDDETEIKVIKRRPPKGNKNKTRKDGRRFTMVRPGDEKSFVHDLKDRYPDLQTDQDLLVETLAEIMRTVKPPEPPKDYYRMKKSKYECVECNRLTESLPAASRHYQEYHGPRYLFCYACGVDFRSKTNLYKHEKCCSAPDAVAVLRARAQFVGNKGRSRPYIHRVPVDYKKSPKNAVRTTFSCHLCSATFYSKQTLLSHSYLHDGLRPYQCSVCPAAYTSYSALSRHFNNHTDVQFICDHCSRSFKIKTALVAHMNTHRPEKKHLCPECGKGFSQKSGMLLHVHRAHRHLPPPCACPICPKRFRRMSLLKIHMQNAHGMHLMTRKMFFRSLPTMTDDQLQRAKVVFKTDVANCDEQYETRGQFATFIPDNEQTLTEDTEHNADSSEKHFEIEITPDVINAELSKRGNQTEATPDNCDSEEYIYTEVVGDDGESSQEYIQTEVTEVNVTSSEELVQTAEQNVVSEELVQEGSSGDIVKVVCIEDGKLVELSTNNINVYQDTTTKGRRLKRAHGKQDISTASENVHQVDNSKLRYFRREKPKGLQTQVMKGTKPDISKNVQQINPTKLKASGAAKPVQIIKTTRVVRRDGHNASVTRYIHPQNVTQQTANSQALRYDTAETTPNETPEGKSTKPKILGASKRQRFFLRNDREDTTPNVNVNVTVEAMEKESDNISKETVVKSRSTLIQQKQSADTASVIQRIGSGVTVTRKIDDKKDVANISNRRQKMNEVSGGSPYKGRLRNACKGPSMPEL